MIHARTTVQVHNERIQIKEPYEAECVGTAGDHYRFQDQRVITATLQNLEEAVEAAKPRPPTLLIVGQVVELQEKLGWYKIGEAPRAHDLIRPVR